MLAQIDRWTADPPPPDVNEMGFVAVILASAVLAFVPAALLNLAVSRLGWRPAMSWARLAVVVLVLTLACWAVFVVVWIVGLTLEAQGIIR